MPTLLPIPDEPDVPALPELALPELPSANELASAMCDEHDSDPLEPDDSPSLLPLPLPAEDPEPACEPAPPLPGSTGSAGSVAPPPPPEPEATDPFGSTSAICEPPPPPPEQATNVRDDRRSATRGEIVMAGARVGTTTYWSHRADRRQPGEAPRPAAAPADRQLVARDAYGVGRVSSATGLGHCPPVLAGRLRPCAYWDRRLRWLSLSRVRTFPTAASVSDQSRESVTDRGLLDGDQSEIRGFPREARTCRSSRSRLEGCL